MILEKNTINFIAADSAYPEANLVLFGAPYDGTSSYRPGSRFGPMAIRTESFGIETYSPYSGLDLNDAKVFDAGDLELPFGSPEKVLGIIEATADEIFRDRKIPIMLGGEHLITYGAVRAAKRCFPELYIIHFDAHIDFRKDYLGDVYSHASVIRLCHGLVGDGRIFQFGIRSGDGSEFRDAEGKISTTLFNFRNLDKAVSACGSAPVYLTVDLDVLDPSEFPGTGTPEAGGVRFTELIEAFHSLRGLNIIGADLNELCPVYDPSGISVAAACKILRELILTLSFKNGKDVTK